MRRRRVRMRGFFFDLAGHPVRPRREGLRRRNELASARPRRISIIDARGTNREDAPADPNLVRPIALDVGQLGRMVEVVDPALDVAEVVLVTLQVVDVTFTLS